jgi:hypothetical protein
MMHEKWISWFSHSGFDLRPPKTWAGNMDMLDSFSVYVTLPLLSELAMRFVARRYT